MKIRPESATLFHVDRRTDEQTHITKLRVAFHYFGNAPKNIQEFQIYRRKYLNAISLSSLIQYHYN